MLQLRVLTALIAAPLVVGSLFLLPLIPFAVVFAVLAGVGLFEWGNLAGLRRPGAKAAYLIGYLILCWVAFGRPAAWPAILAVVTVWWVCAALVVLMFPASAQALRPALLLPLGYLVLLGAWLALVVLKSDPWLIVWAMCVVWAADIGAYFAGRSLGRRKLAVLVSPGKTWEGAFGGTLLAIVVGVALAITVPSLHALADGWRWSVAALVVAIVSIFGDLFESALKRARGVKDSGTFFPGHGGMLDRIDSLIAVLPCFALAVAQYG